MTLRVGPAVAAAAVIMSAASLLAGCASGAPGEGTATVRTNGERGWAGGTPVREGYPLPGQQFRDTSGAVYVPSEDADAPVTLVFFGYTNCPDVCNVVLANIASALRGSSPEVRDAVQVLFIATDPRRDTGPVVREYLDRFDPTYVGLVAPVTTVEAAAKELHVSYERPDGSRAGYLVEHGTYTTAFVGGRSRLVWSPDTSVAALRSDLTRLVSKVT